MTTKKDTPEARRKAFGSALNDAIAVRGLSQHTFAQQVGRKQPTVSEWINGVSEPDTDTVFELERALKLEPGRLSIKLGYLPPEAAKAKPVSFESVVITDPLLDEPAKRGILDLYRALTSRRPNRGGRPRKSS